MESIKLLFAAAAALFISLASFAELAIKPDTLPNATEGVAYDTSLHVELNGETVDAYDWKVPTCATTRESNTFASLDGTRDWFDEELPKMDPYDGRLTLDLGFDFPFAGVTFSEVAVGVYQPDLGNVDGGGKGAGGSLSIQPSTSIAYFFDCLTQPSDGIFIHRGKTSGEDSVDFVTIKWVGHEQLWEPAETTNAVNLAVTLYSDGRIRCIYGDCGGSATLGWAQVNGSDGGDRYEFWYVNDSSTPLGTSFEDILFTPLAGLPNGMQLDPYTGQLTGTPMETGTFTFCVEAATNSSGAVAVSRDYTLAVAASPYAKPTLFSMSPSGEDTREMVVGVTNDFSVVVDANGDEPLTYQWYFGWDAIDGATSSNLNYAATQDDYQYNPYGSMRCVVSSAHWSEVIEVSWLCQVVTPPLGPSGSTTLPSGAQLSEYSHTLTATGGSGSYTFSAPALPTGLSLASDGTLSGTIAAEPGDYGFDVKISDSSYNTTNVHYTLTVTENTDQKPVLDSATPEEDEITVHLGHTQTFTATAHDPEGGDVSYRWEAEGYSEYDYEHPTDESTFIFEPAYWESSGNERVIKLYLSDSVWTDVLVKSWTVTISEGPIEFTTTELPDATADEDYNASIGYQGGDGLLEHSVSGLPSGLTESYLYISGAPREPGDYVVTVKLVANDSSICETNFTLHVGGTFTKRTWYVDADNGSYYGDGLSPETAVTSPECFVGKPLASGDEVVIFGSENSVPDNAILDSVGKIVVTNGPVQVQVLAGRPAAWCAKAVCADGAGLTLDLQEGNGTNLYFVGFTHRVAKMPTDWEDYGFNIISTDGLIDGDPFVDAEGWTSVRVVGWGQENAGYYDEGYLKLHYPDDDQHKDYTLVDWTRAARVEVLNDGALPQTLAITGAVNIANFEDDSGGETHTTVKSGSIVDLDYNNVIAHAWRIRGLLTLEPDTRFVISPSNKTENASVVFLIENLGGLELPEDGVVLELTHAMASEEKIEIVRNYLGNGHEFSLATAAGDNPSNYQFYVYSGSLWLKRNPVPVGTYTPKSTSATVRVGDSFDFYVHQKANDEDVTKDYKFLMPFFTVAEDTKNTFDSSKGRRIFARTGGPDAYPIVELEFRFPIGGFYYDRVMLDRLGRIGFDVNGTDCDYWLDILGNIDADGLTEEIMAIDSSADHFTVRWSELFSVTLTPDGKIRVAFGPCADQFNSLGLNSNGDRVTRFRCQSDDYHYWHETDTVYERYSDNTYANAPDAVFTPTGRFELNWGYVVVPGTYNFALTRILPGDVRGETKNFTMSVPAEAGEHPTAICPTLSKCTPDCVDFVRVRQGEKVNFSVDVAAAAGTRCRCNWYGPDDTLLRQDILESGTSTLSWVASPYDNGWSQITCAISAIPEVGGEDGFWIGSMKRVWTVQVVRDIYFNPSYDGEERDGSETKPYRDFTDGLFGNYSVRDGDRLILAPGTYNERLALYPRLGVTVIGSGAANTFIDRSGSAFSQTESVFDATAGGVVTRACTNSVISGVTIRNATALGNNLGEEEAEHGGGALGGTFVNCVFSNCVCGVYDLGSVPGYGGAAYGAVLKNCLLSECHATTQGGGASNCELWNCTVVNCWADEAAGGIDGTCKAYNTILRYNTVNGVENNFEKTRAAGRLTDDVPVLMYCCTDREPTYGKGTVLADPQLNWNYRLGHDSPCIGAGLLDYAPNAATDLDGAPRVTIDDNGTNICIGAFERPVTIDEERVRVYLVTDGDGGFANLSSPIVGEDPVHGPYAVVSPVTDPPLSFTLTGRPLEEYYIDGVQQALTNEFSIPIAHQTELFFVFSGYIFHVDPVNGNDGNSGLDWDNALMTLGAARNRVCARDEILLKPGTYAPVDFSDFTGRLAISTTGSAADTIIDANNYGRCFRASSTNIVVTGLSFVNGNTYSSYYEDAGYGAGVWGGTFIDCAISNCLGKADGGGAYKATLIRCTLAFNTCKTQDHGGGGAANCIVDDCLIYGNTVRAGDAVVRVKGSGTYLCDVRNSYLWANQLLDEYGDASLSDADEGYQYISSLGGYSLHNELHQPEGDERESRPTPVLPGSVLADVYDSAEIASNAVSRYRVDLSGEVALAGRRGNYADTQESYQNYENLFEFVPRAEWSRTMAGSVVKYRLVMQLKPAVQTEIREDITKSVQEIPVTELGKTQFTYQINDTIPGLYYAVEFTDSLGTKPFEGERFLANGSSVDVDVSTTDSTTGFWRIGVYVAP